MDKIDRVDRIIGFITANYCQHCQENYSNKCKMEKLQIKYSSYALSLSQASAAKRFSFDPQQNICKNYVEPKGYPGFLHVTEVLFDDGRKETHEWLSNKEISELWGNPEVVDIDIVFTDV